MYELFRRSEERISVDRISSKAKRGGKQKKNSGSRELKRVECMVNLQFFLIDRILFGIREASTMPGRELLLKRFSVRKLKW